MFSKEIKQKIQQVVNVFETGSPIGDYANVSIYYDGPNNIQQITYGRSQTTEFSNLKKLIQMYIEAKGTYAEDFKKYVNKIGRLPSFCGDKIFINFLRAAGKEQIMKDVQDKFFDLVYWAPAFKFFEENKFKSPLSMLVIYDSFVHGGLAYVRKKFPEVTPLKGGEEKDWTTAYVKARHQWLKYHPRKILNNTIYRTETLMSQIKEGNWNLDKKVNIRGVYV